MGLLKPAQITTAYFKCGILGFQGSGKTFTAMLLAYGLAKTLKLTKIAFFDTEKGSDFFVKDMAKNEIELFQVKSRSFSDLIETIQECQQENIPILVVDSVTHLWRELCDAFTKKLNRKRLQFQDWAIVKGEWHEFTDSLINAPLHMIICGRAGYEYDYDIDIETGDKDLIKIGTRMKAESETGFEPDLVIQMEAISGNLEDLSKIKVRKHRIAFRPKIGSEYIHRAHILKDRADAINGKKFDDPTFEDFLPHFEVINIGGEHIGFDSERNSQDRFTIEGKTDKQIYAQNKEIALESIKNAMLQMWPGRSAEETKSKVDFNLAVFGTRAWKEIEQRSLEELSSVADKMDSYIEAYNESKDIKKAWEAVKDA